MTAAADYGKGACTGYVELTALVVGGFDSDKTGGHALDSGERGRVAWVANRVA